MYIKIYTCKHRTHLGLFGTLGRATSEHSLGNPRAHFSHDTAQYYPQPYSPQLHIRTTQGLLQGHPGFVWALLWRGAILSTIYHIPHIVNKQHFTCCIPHGVWLWGSIELGPIKRGSKPVSSPGAHRDRSFTLCYSALSVCPRKPRRAIDSSYN